MEADRQLLPCTIFERHDLVIKESPPSTPEGFRILFATAKFNIIKTIITF